MKNKICILLLALSLIMPAYSENENIMPENTTEQVNEVVADTEQADVTEQTVTEQETAIQEEPKEEVAAPTPYKQPVSKKRIIKKFLLAMLGVLASSLIIFVGLSVYNRFREILTANTSMEGDEKILETPENISEAVKSFVDKTKWEG